MVAGAAMVVMAARVYRIREGAAANKAAMQMFGFSIVYLFMLVALLSSSGSALRSGERW